MATKHSSKGDPHQLRTKKKPPAERGQGLGYGSLAPACHCLDNTTGWRRIQSRFGGPSSTAPQGLRQAVPEPAAPAASPTFPTLEPTGGWGGGCGEGLWLSRSVWLWENVGELQMAAFVSRAPNCHSLNLSTTAFPPLPDRPHMSPWRPSSTRLSRSAR